MNTKQITFDILNQEKLRAKKKFGQNFLVDDSILEDIVKKSNISENEVVVEIGPGLGNLTEYILKDAKKVIAFEIDKDMVEVLKDRFSTDKLTIINEDILNVNLNDYVDKDKKIKIIANLPYYITTPILFKLFENTNNISEIVVMVQKEVANRIVAKNKSKEYGILTIGANFYSQPSIIIYVNRDAFVPAPNVDSAVLKMSVKRRYEVKDEKLFFEFVKKAFAQRRKKVINSLESTNFNNLSKDQIKNILQNSGINENARAEEITIEEYVKIINEM